MTEQEKIERLISPENFFPSTLQRGKLMGNPLFIEAISGYCKALSESQFWPRERLEEIQIKRLRNLTSRIAGRSPFWADFFQKHGFSPNAATLADFAHLPVLRRKNLLEFGDAIYVEPQPEDYPLFRRTSSGTTGVPLRYLFAEWEMVEDATFLFRHPAIEEISLVVELLSRKPYVVLGKPGSRYNLGKDFFYRTFTIKSPDLDNPEIRKEIYKSIYEAAPAILVGFGSLIAKLSELVSEDGITLPLLAIMTQSEPISSAEWENINKVFGVPTINMLCGNATGVIGFECPENPGRLHVNSENIILEVIGEDGTALPVGEEGELVATSLTKTLTPHIRWAQDDIGRLIPETCSCGRILPLFEFQGRRGYEVVLPSGKKVRVINLHNALASTGLSQKSKQIQIIQERPDNLRLLIIPKKSFDDSCEIKIRLALTELFYGEKVTVDIEYVENIHTPPSGKPQFFVPFRN